MQSLVPRIAITAGEPSGIGPDIVIDLAERGWPAELVVIADPNLIADRALQLGKHIEIHPYDVQAPAAANQPGRLIVTGEPLGTACATSRLDPTNAEYVIATLKRACAGCQSGEFMAMVTAPVNKGVINDAGIPFSGHTEFLAEQTSATQPVMLLVADTLRVALMTTHLALKDVPAAITGELIQRVFKLLHLGLVSYFGIESPRIIVLGLNPHAGEAGYLGQEEINIIEPALTKLATAGYQPIGPLPADTAFTLTHLSRADAVLAMYHDQGLPVLKNNGFGKAVNVTLGLPIIRTSVDHGTALDLAGTGLAKPDSLYAALSLAIEMASNSSP
ncbi:MAG: 4-hydroxythreonine-4-phosphate dehydrogenase PdxA [Gammaproteobacteria bacterium]|nr:4-hydroxythreonine-4-phosphate dehydrogenase PdxA [Chromatiales bacterium]MDP6674115.1 4-hydroxythreonine-4-phosphate dehydrogenase PdxA [Gammaproteobacteria bacterium]